MERKITAPANQPLSFYIDDAEIVVEVGTSDEFEVYLSTEFFVGSESVKAIEAATLSNTGGVHRINVPDRASTGGGKTVVKFGRGGGVSVYGGTASVEIRNNRVFVGGREVKPGNCSHTPNDEIQVTMRVPANTDLEIRTESGSVSHVGETLASLKFSAISGDVSALRVGQFVAQTQSGTVRVSSAHRVSAQTQSGNIRVAQGAQVNARTMSGNIRVSELGGDCVAQSMSGDIEVTALVAGTVSAESMSGDVEVRDPNHLYGHSLTVLASSMSGKVYAPR